jgi:AsmA protein
MAEAEILSVERLRGTIRLLPLIIGRIEIGAFSMERPVVRLVRDEAGERNWAFDSGAAALQLAFAGDVPLGKFSIEGGTLLFEDRSAGTLERLDQAKLDIEWESVRQPLSVAGGGVWRGEPVSFAGSVGAPFEFLNGGSTPIEARFDSARLTMGFAGEALDRDAVRLAGELSLASPSLQALAGWFGSPLADAEALGAARLSGDAVLDGGLLSVTDAELALNGNEGAGAVEIRVADPPSVVGTLAFPSLDLSAYFAGLRNALTAEGGWREVGLDTDWFGDLAADVRLSAGSVALGEFSFGETAASVILSDRRLEIGVAEAAFGGGLLAGDVAIIDRGGKDSFAAAAQLRAQNVNLSEVASGWREEVAGTANVQVDLAGEGTDLGSLVASLDGRASIEIVDGALPLGDLATFVGRAPNGVVPVEAVAAELHVAGGAATLAEGAIFATDFEAALRGVVSLLDLRLNLNGEARLRQPSAEQVSISVRGTLADPLVDAPILAE